MLLFAFQSQHAIAQRDVDVLFIESRQFGNDLYLLVVFADFDIRQAGRPAIALQRFVEVVEEIVEQPVQLAMQRQERTGFVARALARQGTFTAPRNETFHIHVGLRLLQGSGNGSRALPGPAPVRRAWCTQRALSRQKLKRSPSVSRLLRTNAANIFALRNFVSGHQTHRAASE